MAALLTFACGGDAERSTESVDSEPRTARPATPADQQLAPGLRVVFDRVNEGHHDAARVLLATYLESSDEANAYQAAFLLGYSYQKQKLYEQAKEHFLRAIALQPDYHPPHHFLGFAHYYLGELDDARRAFEAHLDLRPDEGDNHFGIGLCDLDEGRLDEAERRFALALELHAEAAARGVDRRRELGKCRARLGDVHEQRGDDAAARHQYEQAVLLWPAHYEVWHKLHRVLLRLGEDELAAVAARRHEEWKERVRGGGP